MTMDEWLTLPEIAKLLRIRQAKPVGWIKSGRLKAINVGDGKRPRYRVSRSALDEFLAAQEVAPESKPVRRTRREKPAGYIEYV